VLDTLKGSGARVIDAPAIKTDRDKADFAAHEFRRARRKATAEAVHALVEAVGKDVRELAAACQQLVDDTTGVIDEKVVMTYHGGRSRRRDSGSPTPPWSVTPGRPCACCGTPSPSGSTRCR
jgi:DNA polymerase-3 subunit delta